MKTMTTSLGETRALRFLIQSVAAISVYLALPTQAQSTDAITPVPQYISPISLMPLNPVPFAIELELTGFPLRGQYISPMSLLPLPDYSYTAGYPVSPLWRDRGLTIDPFSLLPWIPPETIVPAVVAQVEGEERIIPLSAFRTAPSETHQAIVTALNSAPSQIASVVSPGPVVVDFPPGTTIRR